MMIHRALEYDEILSHAQLHNNLANLASNMLTLLCQCMHMNLWWWPTNMPDSGQVAVRSILLLGPSRLLSSLCGSGVRELSLVYVFQ